MLNATDRSLLYGVCYADAWKNLTEKCNIVNYLMLMTEEHTVTQYVYDTGSVLAIRFR